jgi:23S rRNA pseudouridine2605 synthase
MTMTTDKDSAANDSADRKGERIAKVLARAGVASRREAERLIQQGRISVNGITLTTPAFLVGPGDELALDGERIAGKEPARLWRYHKPAGLVTTHRDEKDRRTVFDTLPEHLPRVISVGRLDVTSEGLLLLTNDGELARAMELPSTGWTRRYRVRAFGKADEKTLAKLKQGVEVEGVRYGPVEVKVERSTPSHMWLMVGIREGKNREVRKVLQSVGLAVNRLIRISYGPFQLGNLPEGEVEEVTAKVLAEQAPKSVRHLFDKAK